MNVYITRINGISFSERTQYMQNMTAEIAQRLSIREMGIYRYNGEGENAESLNARIDGIIAGINRDDLVICQFPTGNGLRFEWSLINHLKAYGGRVAIFLHDFEPLLYESKRSILREVVNLYNQAEVMIVPSIAMQQFLMGNGIKRDMKFVIQEMWDYTIEKEYLSVSAFINSKDFEGMRQGEELLNLSERFGLLWYKDANDREYMRYGISFLMSKLLATGIPVVVPVGVSCQELIEENHLGFAINSTDEAVAQIKKMSTEEYQDYVQAVSQFAPALRKGYYTENCLIEAMQLFYKKRAGRLSIPMKTYSLKKGTFSFIVLKESHGGNLALSWNFRDGKADGFLIYDADGVLVSKIDNTHGHYSLIKGYEAENGFCVKAYMETLKGKMIIAESKTVYLEAELSEKPKVSLIIPAYNAEDYIARSIDNALAQSFPELEIIVVDDGSTDATANIVDWYAGKFSNVRAVHQENSGVAAARNAGIVQANGEYIGFMDSDDMLYPDMVARLYYSAKKNDCDIAITSAYQITNSGYEIWIQYRMEEDTAVPVDVFLREHYTPSCGFGLIVWNKLYRLSLVKEHLFPEVRDEEDVSWTPYILSYADKICYLNDCSYEWDRVIRDCTLGIQLGKRSKEERFAGYKRDIMFYLNHTNPDKLELIKGVAMTHLACLSVWYGYSKYEELRKQIEKFNRSDFYGVEKI